MDNLEKSLIGGVVTGIVGIVVLLASWEFISPMIKPLNDRRQLRETYKAALVLEDKDLKDASKQLGEKYQEVLVLADNDKDGVTSPNEWSRVYQESGIHYDSSNPAELTLEQLQKYLNSR